MFNYIYKYIHSVFIFIQVNKYKILEYLLLLFIYAVFAYCFCQFSWILFSHYLRVQRIAKRILRGLLHRQKDPFLDPRFAQFLASYSQRDLLSQPMTSLLDVYSKMSMINSESSKIILELWFRSNYYGKISLKIFVIKQILVDSPLEYDRFIRQINNLFFKDYQPSNLSFDNNLYIDLIDENKLVYLFDPFYNIQNKHLLDNIFGNLDVKLINKYQLDFNLNKEYPFLSKIKIDTLSLDSNLKDFIFNFFYISEEDPFCTSISGNIFLKTKSIDLWSFDSNIASKLNHGYLDFLSNNITYFINFIYDIFF